MLIYLFIFIIGSFLFYLLKYIVIFFSDKLTIEVRSQNFLKKRIKKNYIIIALCGGLSSILVYHFYINWPTLVTLYIFLVLLTIISVVDNATMEIPNIFVLATFVLGAFSIFTMPGTSLPSRILGMFIVSVPLLLITLLVPGAFGGGDIKLMAACGLFLGTKLTLLSFAFAVLTGGLYGIWLLVMKKKSGKEHFAFGPFLCLGMAAALFIGDRVWDWYAGLLYL